MGKCNVPLTLFEDYQRAPHMVQPPYREIVQIGSRRKIVWDKEKQSLTSSVSVYLTGLDKNYHQWFRWHTQSMEQIVRSKKTGRFSNRVMFSTTQTKSGMRFYSDRPRVWREIDSEAQNNPIFPAEKQEHQLGYWASEVFNFDFRLSSVYPMSEIWPGAINGWHRIPTGMPELKVSNPREFVESIFGKKNYRKDLMKAVTESGSPVTVNVAAAFVDYVPIDWIINFLRLHKEFPAMAGELGVDYGVVNYRKLRRALGYYTPNEYRRLLRTQLTVGDIYSLQDLLGRYINRMKQDELGAFIQQGRQLNNARVRRFRDFHDHLFNNQRRQLDYEPFHISVRRDITPETEIPVTKDAAIIDSSPVFTLPKTVKDLMEWGSYMRNCIASYSGDVVRKDSNAVLGAVIVDKKIYANFEIRDRQLKQLLGPCNQTLNVHFRKKLEMEFERLGIRVPATYWGNNE